MRGKDAEQNAEQFRTCLDIIKKAGSKVGMLTKDPAAGPFVDEWKAAFGEIEKDVEQIDMSVAISSAALSIKDERELVSAGQTVNLCRVPNRPNSALFEMHLAHRVV